MNTKRLVFFAQQALRVAALVAILGDCAHSKAVTILSTPLFNKASKAPLAGKLVFTTDVPARVSVSVTDGTDSWQRDFYDYSFVHSVPLFGFKPNRTNEITVTVHDQSQNEFTAPEPVIFTTAALPSGFPVLNVLVSKPEMMEPGYTLFRGVNADSQVGYLTIVDPRGEVVWYSSSITASLDVRQLPDGNLFLPLSTNFTEVNLLGDTVKSWTVPAGWKIDFHDGVPTPHGSILYLNDDSRVVTNFPTSATNPNAPTATTNIMFNRVIEMSATDGTLLNNWSLLDLLDPLRIGYLTFVKTSQGWDSEHSNAVIEDPRDNTLIVSIRTQNAVVKFTRDGKLKWILGPHENWGPEFQPYLLTPAGTPFEWNYAQHQPVITPQGTLILYDDGNFRASPFDASVPDSQNYSRAVEYAVDEEKMEVRQVWEYGGRAAEPLYTGALGSTDPLPETGNVLINFGLVSYVNHVHPSAYSTNATMARIIEVTHEQDPEVVFDLALFNYTNKVRSYKGNWVYRAHRIPDLYGHPALPVSDLTIRADGTSAHLEFSADPFRSYTLEVSTDLANWTEIGSPEPSEDGTFSFEDDTTQNSGRQFYRVVTR